jgi:hypothetical protein
MFAGVNLPSSVAELILMFILEEGEKLFSEFKNRNIEYAFPMRKLVAR